MMAGILAPPASTTCITASQRVRGKYAADVSAEPNLADTLWPFEAVPVTRAYAVPNYDARRSSAANTASGA